MPEFAERIVEAILQLEGAVIYALVGLFAWAEAAFFLGFVTPGEVALAAGGVLSSRGQVVLAGVAVAAATGTVLGNSTGFWLGRTWGNRVLEWRPVQRWLGGVVNKARETFLARGEWAIVGGRLTSFLRIVVPFVAGASGMSYRRFLLFDVPTGIVWAVSWVVVGFMLGESWRVLISTAGQAAFLVLGLFFTAALIGWVALRVLRLQDRVTSIARGLLASRAMVRVLRITRPPLRWIGRRFSPRIAGGLQLTLGFLVLLVGVAGAGLVVSQTRAVAGLALVDFPVLEWMGEVRTDDAVAVARGFLPIFHVPGMAGLAVLLLAAGWWRGSWMTGLRAGLGLAGAGLGAWVLEVHVLEGVVPGAEFPSVPVAVAGALLVHGVAVAGMGMAWGRGVLAAAVLLFLLITVAVAAVVAGVAAPSGIALGAAIGTGWSAILEIPPRIPWSVRAEVEDEVEAKAEDDVEDKTAF
ncbi:MAG: DedA family protein [Gemmatimonadales bacterium]|nr:MAG: DedA family protein [Gemmatimonadales bacterium]